MIRKWTKETILEEGKKFSSRVEWKNKSSGSYSIAGRNKWLDEACSHMPPLLGRKNGPGSHVWLRLKNTQRLKSSQKMPMAHIKSA